MKRFYKSVSVAASQAGKYMVLLDGKTIKTAKGNIMEFAGKGLADFLAAEWASVSGEIVPLNMPITRILSQSVDMDAVDREISYSQILFFLPTDHALFRVNHPVELKRMQDESLGPILEWFNAHYSVNLQTITDITGKGSCCEEDLYKISTLISELDNLHLAVLDSSVKICNSVVIGFAILENQLDSQTALRLINLEHLYQEEKWGEDPEIISKRANIEKELIYIKTLINLIKGKL